MVRIGGGWQSLQEYLESSLSHFFGHSLDDAKVQAALKNHATKTYKHTKTVTTVDYEPITEGVELEDSRIRVDHAIDFSGNAADIKPHSAPVLDKVQTINMYFTNANAIAR